MTFVRKYFRHALIVLGLGFSATSDVNAIEYLLTTTAAPEADLNGNTNLFNYTNGNTPPASSIDLLVRLYISNADAQPFLTNGWSIYTGNFVLNINDPTVATITNVGIVVPPNWDTGALDTTVPNTYTATFVNNNNGWQPTAGGYFLTLGTFSLTNFNLNATSQASANVSVQYNGDKWVTDGGTLTYFEPTASGFLVTVPEPSTYISAAMACAALSGVALKKRKAKKAVATA